MTKETIMLKEIATKVSELVTADAKVDLSDYLELLFRDDKNQQQIKTPKTETKDKIGRWQKDKDTGDYVKNPDYNQENLLWSNKEVIPADKKEKYRIAYIGESVARGTHFPHDYAPADVLDTILNSAGSDQEIEVIDLAKAGIQLGELLEVTAQSLKLNPDLIVVFAGNNWQPGISLCTPGNHQQLKKVARTSNQDNFIEKALHGKLEYDIEYLTNYLAEIQTNKAIPVVYVLPEFNLQDWKTSEKENAVRFLGGNQIKKWVDLRDACNESEQSQDWEKLSIQTDEIIALDPKHPFGYDKKAVYYTSQNDKDKVKYYLEKARDTTMLNATDSTTPRRFSVIRELITDHLSNKNIELLDLENVFNQHLDGGLSNKNLFFDYCHLTAEGIQTTMTSLASRILNKMDVEVEEEVLSSVTHKPTTNQESLAHFQAAIHNYYFGQPYSTIFHHSCRAVELADDDLLEIIKDFCFILSEKSAPYLSKNARSIVSKNIVEQYNFLKYPRYGKLLGVDLVDALTSALRTLKSINIVEDITQLRLREYNIGKEEVNLLESSYSQESMQKYLCDMEYAFYRAHDTKSKFNFITDGQTDLAFDLTTRIPYKESYDIDDSFSVSINGNIVTGVKLTSDWEKNSFVIKHDQLKEGVNIIEIHWTTPTKEIQQKVNKSLSVPVDIVGMLYFTFGEIFSFNVKSA